MIIDKYDLVSNVCELVSLPQVCTQVVSMVDDPLCTIEDIVNLIQHDVYLTARLLKIGNSPVYGFSGQIGTLKEAVKLIGTSVVRDLVFAATMIKQMSTLNNPNLSASEFWTQSLLTAITAKHIARLVPSLVEDRLFVCGLLLDLGRLVIHNQMPEEGRMILHAESINSDLSKPHLAEKKILGYDHSEVGYILATNWHFPDHLSTCIQFHHNPDACSHYQKEVSACFFADDLVDRIQHSGQARIDESRLARSLKLLGLSNDNLRNVMKPVVAELQEAVSVFLGGDNNETSNHA